jgi:glycosyltransferase involved in cell wall biosynthesis
LKLIIHAPNVHQGGGKTLLLSLLRAAVDRTSCTLLADGRLTLPQDLTDALKLYRFVPTIVGRLRAERWLRSIARSNDVVLCFGNLPPLYALDAQVCLFLQNRYLCDAIPLSGFPWSVRARIAIERFLVRRLVHHAGILIVQTPSMQECARVALGVEAALAPFVEGATRLAPRTGKSPTAPALPKKLIYVASGEPHKNHRILLQAWRLLAREGITAELHLTLEAGEFARSLAAVCAEADWRQVVNHGEVNGGAVSTLYAGMDALIYASTLEAFGLPLIEAKLAGLPVIAPELDYVRDVVVPDQTFDPGSPRSIARAVKRFLGLPGDHVQLLDPAEFVERILARRV